MKAKYILLIFFIPVLISCKKFIQVAPPRNLITEETVYSSDATAISVIRGIYSQMINGGGFASGGSSSVTVLSGLSADEFKNYSTSSGFVAFYTNAITTTNFQNALWQEPYKYINNANALIEGVSSSTGITAATKNKLLGEAKFVRAFCHFYLVNLFGDVPIVTTTDYTVNNSTIRKSKSDVYDQIITDLKDAQNLLLSDYSFSNNEPTQPNKWAATALLARVYLYKGDWAKAESEATSVINSSSFSLLTDLDKVFLGNSKEAIWQLKPSALSYTNEGSFFILTGTPGNVALSTQLLNSFEPGDVRATKWVSSYTSGSNTYYFPFKYKVKSGSTLTEYSMVLRFAEQYLIRAEARAQQNNLTGAIGDLDMIRSRAGLPLVAVTNPGISKSALLDKILHEKQVELFSEWGHRWLDLKRTGIVDAVMSIATSQKSGTWNSYQQLYPLPQSEILNNSNLSQNPNY